MNRLAMLLAAAVAASAPMPTEADTAVWKANAGGDITVGDNWESGSAPAAGDILDFSAITSAQTLTGGFADDRVFAYATFGTGVATLAGDLHLTTLTNANKLAVASGANLVVNGDIAAFQYVYNNTASMAFLHSNEGNVAVGGAAVGGADKSGGGNYGWVQQYESVTSASKPIRAGGLRYLVVYLTSPYFGLARSGVADEWIVGSGGLAIENAQNNDRVSYRCEGAATLRSAADWTLGKSAKNNVTKDLHVTESGSLVIDTTDFDDGTTPHTVTLSGRLVADKAQDAAAVTVTGNGTVVVATSVTTGSNKSTKIENAIAVADAATLQINAGASYVIRNVMVASGATLHVPSTAVNTSDTTVIEKVTLAEGATLSLPSASATTLVARGVPLSLPADGKAYLRIDGPELKPGEYTVLSSVPEGYAAHLSVVGTALGTRSARLSDDGASLKMTVLSKGLVITLR